MRDSAMRTVATLDRDAEIYRSLSDELVRFATAIAGRNEAADIVSTVVLRILSKRRLADLDEPRPYLYRAVTNRCINFYELCNNAGWLKLKPALNRPI